MGGPISVILVAVILISAGIYFLIVGLKKSKVTKLILNIPTSKIGSITMGLVELKGVAKQRTQLMSPITNTPCVYYTYKIQTVSREGLFTTIASGNSDDEEFYLRDDTGEVVVNPEGVELFSAPNSSYITALGLRTPERIEELLDQHGLGLTLRTFHMLDGNRIKCIENYIPVHSQIYVLGVAMNRLAYRLQEDRKLRFLEKLKLFKRNRFIRKRYDLDKDGKISQKEAKLAQDHIKKSVLAESQKAEDEGIGKIVIEKGNEAPVFIISDKSEKKIVAELGSSAILYFLASPLLFLAGVYFLYLVHALP